MLQLLASSFLLRRLRLLLAPDIPCLAAHRLPAPAAEKAAPGLVVLALHSAPGLLLRPPAYLEIAPALLLLPAPGLRVVCLRLLHAQDPLSFRLHCPHSCFQVSPARFTRRKCAPNANDLSPKKNTGITMGAYRPLKQYIYIYLIGYNVWPDP